MSIKGRRGGGPFKTLLLSRVTEIRYHVKVGTYMFLRRPGRQKHYMTCQRGSAQKRLYRTVK